MGAPGRLLRVAAALALVVATAGQTVRKINKHSDFRKALELTKKQGKFLVVDFYTDACGPCRMIAPAFKELAKQHADTAVFAKVDTRVNGESAQKYQVRSTPTFMYFVDGKSKPAYQFSGAGEQQLRHYADLAKRDAAKVYVEISRDLLGRYYAKYDAEKSEEAVDKIYEKCCSMSKSDRCEGSTAVDLAKKLGEKYGKGPRPEKKQPPAKGEKKEKERPARSRASSSSSSSTSSSSRSKKKQSGGGGAAAGVGLHGVGLEELMMELERRGHRVLSEEEASAYDAAMTGGADVADDIEDLDEDDEEEMDDLTLWTPRADAAHVEKVAIIGAGPAGLSAAVYSARAGLEPVVIAPPVGGQLQGKGVQVENYPGVFAQTGPQLVADMQRHAGHFGAKFLYEFVDDVDFTQRPFTLTAGNATLRAHAVILSTGADAKWLNVAGEEEFRGGGVSSCATCDGYLFRDQPTVVIGGGDAAMEDALVLARTSSSVTILHRRDAFRASKILADRVKENAKIDIRWNTTVSAFDGEAPCLSPSPSEVVVEAPGAAEASCLKQVHVKNKDGEEDTLAAAAAFVAIGHNPNTGIFQGALEVDATGYLVTQQGSTMTSVPGVFAAGDVADKIYRQAITSAGSGAMAALDAERWLSENGLGIDAVATAAAAAAKDEL
uniref:Thioredoxin domain-containing protein n=1 Tax=Phaeomonas parva TaxID=124430 RepID=A0A7S1XW40_9STRA|mmetsp:Transcript_45141/g.141432  ORF Transcript_45141/g.141432 Transcript_45141/m.141432 type:complete len:664 (+) Transcript_45141:158-2149(+)